MPLPTATPDPEQPQGQHRLAGDMRLHHSEDDQQEQARRHWPDDKPGRPAMIGALHDPVDQRGQPRRPRDRASEVERFPPAGSRASQRHHGHDDQHRADRHVDEEDPPP
ncbi:hypothetical protein [Microtetraspora malaysiensis]|uniref:hypothetical protein n=1 Tax=Microtetraspora malaysiensis TaxID=161358 RepID=UPI003D8F21C4